MQRCAVLCCAVLPVGALGPGSLPPSLRNVQSPGSRIQSRRRAWALPGYSQQEAHVGRGARAAGPDSGSRGLRTAAAGQVRRWRESTGTGRGRGARALPQPRLVLPSRFPPRQAAGAEVGSAAGGRGKEGRPGPATPTATPTSGVLARLERDPLIPARSENTVSRLRPTTPRAPRAPRGYPAGSSGPGR